MQQGKLQQQLLHGILRSNSPGVFCKKVALKTYGGITRNDLYDTICMNLIRFSNLFIQIRRDRTHPSFKNCIMQVLMQKVATIS